MNTDCVEPFPQQIITPEDKKQRNAGGGVRHDNRQVDKALNGTLQRKIMSGQDIGQRHSQNKPDNGGNQRGIKCQPN